VIAKFGSQRGGIKMAHNINIPVKAWYGEEEMSLDFPDT
jgi:hypothetical protein